MQRFPLVLLALCLAACGITPSAPTLPPDPTATPQPLAPTAPATPLPDNTLVIFNRAGGYAVTDKTLTVMLDGSARLEDKAGAAPVEWMLSADQLASLKIVFDDPGFAVLPFDTEVFCADCYVITLNALTPRGPVAARVDSADLDFGNNVVVPPALQQAITLLNEIMNTAP